MALIDDLIASYSFENNGDDDTGTYDATPAGSPVYVSGQIGQAASNAGSAANYFTMGPLPLGTGAAFTIEAWLYVAGSLSTGTILGQGGGLFGAPLDYLLYSSSGTGRAHFNYAFGAGSDSGIALVGGGNWNHIVCAYDGTTMRWLINGVVGTPATFALSNPFEPDLILLNDVADPAFPQPHPLDMLRVWTRALDLATEGADLWNGGDGLSFAEINVLPPPTISDVTPATDVEAGGAALTITGTDFVTGATVTIGGVPALSVQVNSDTEIECLAPAGFAGARDLVVTNPDAQSDTLVGGFLYTVAPPVFTKYGQHLRNLLPPGPLWNLEGTSATHKALLAMGDESQRVEDRGVDLVEESDPRTADETLADWERAVGLPDELVTAIPGTTAGRRVAITSKVVARGGQNLEFFDVLCAAAGYPLVSITKYANEVLRCGPTSLAAGFVFRVDDRVYGAAYAYAILITVDPATTGALTHAEFERLIRARVHSHIQVMFTYL